MSHELPFGARRARTTAEFSEVSVPPGLLRDHRIARGVWGRLVVRSGALQFAFADEAMLSLHEGDVVVIPPERTHRVVTAGSVRFVVEFYDLPDDAPDTVDA